MHEYVAKYVQLLEDEPDHDKRVEIANEWWGVVFDVLVEEKLDESKLMTALNEAYSHGSIGLRSGAKELLELMNANGVPVIIFSASGLGSPSIKHILQLAGCDFPNVDIISNQLQFDENGNFVGAALPYVHAQNKTHDFLLAKPELRAKLVGKNTLVLGDEVGDLLMGTPESLYIALEPVKNGTFDACLTGGRFEPLFAWV